MKGIIKKIIFVLYQLIFNIAGKIIPKNEKIIIFESFLGRQYSDNPRAIYEYIKDNLPEYQLYWSVDRATVKHFVQKDIPYAKRFSLKWLLLMNRAKYWVTNSRLPYWIPKPKNTIYIQTWHGTPLKKLGTDINNVVMAETNTDQYHKEFVDEANKWDYLISPNSYSSKIFRRAFQFTGKIIESGYPRNDVLTNNNHSEIIKKLKEKNGLPTNKKIILYAPTWRDNEYYDVGKYKFNMKIDLEKMQSEFGDDYIILLRWHYLIADNINLRPFKDFVFDYSHYEDIRELYLISDVLITDYSSVFFDYAILGRPMIFFVDDLEEYRNNIRGFYFDFEKEAPGPLVKTTEELIEAISQLMRETEPNKNYEQFQATYCSLEEGNATKTVVDKILLSQK